ncbi:hypothetical protein LUZ60_010358 [Juncus effusus]|nr:hypothetical protein LUZ60_010358 [Juncus effusus]
MRTGDAMSTDERRFDASQYTFFGKEIPEEGELGGIDEEEENEDFVPDPSYDEFHFSSVGDRELAEAYDSLSHIDDLSSTFAKLNRAVSDPPRHTGIIGDRSSFSRDSSNTTEWIQETETQNWNSIDNNNNKIWWSNPLTLTESNSKPLFRTSSSPNHNPPPHHFLTNKPPLTESNSSLHRTSSSPNQNPPHHHFLTKPPLTDSNSPLQRTSSSPNQNPPPHHLQNFPSKPPLTESNLKSLHRASSSPNQNPPHQHHHQNSLNRPKFATRSHDLSNLTRHASSPSPSLSPLSSSLQQQLSLYGNLNLNLNSVGDLSNLSSLSNYSNFSSQGQNRLLPNLLLQQQQQQMLNLNPNSLIPSILLAQNQISPSFPNYPNLNHFNSHSSNSNSNSNSNFRDQRTKSSPNKTKQKDRFTPDSNLPQFKSKYMTQEEIQNVHKIQHNISSHNNTNSYTTDYYHQACLSKRGAKCPFYPSSLKDVTNTNPKSRSGTETLSFLPSLRKPLERETNNTTTQPKNFIRKPLERETMVSVRITIEDCFSLLLDIDDIDRTIKLSLPTDGGYQLKKRRQILLESLASSLQLTDPLRTDKKPDDPFDPLDRIFLLIISLPKGRKLVSRFLKLVPAGADLSRIICMAVFRHLRHLFGSLPADKSSSETLIELANIVCLSVCEFELSGLSACLAAVVCSPEQPPLRPVGCLAGDGATLALKSVLDKATQILLSSTTDCNVSGRILWQASFDAFFGLLSKYCVGKYESLMRGFGGKADVAREMPVELLRASLPHTNENQRRVLMDFAQRSMADPVHVS